MYKSEFCVLQNGIVILVFCLINIHNLIVMEVNNFDGLFSMFLSQNNTSGVLESLKKKKL